MRDFKAYEKLWKNITKYTTRCSGSCKKRYIGTLAWQSPFWTSSRYTVHEKERAAVRNGHQNVRSAEGSQGLTPPCGGWPADDAGGTLPGCADLPAGLTGGRFAPTIRPCPACRCPIQSCRDRLCVGEFKTIRSLPPRRWHENQLKTHAKCKHIDHGPLPRNPMIKATGKRGGLRPKDGAVPGGPSSCQGRI